MLSIILYRVPCLKLVSLFKLVISVLDKERQPDEKNILTFIHDLFTIQKTL